MINEIKKVAELQLQYSSKNTPAMQERGVIIRNVLPEIFREHIGESKLCLGKFSDDLKIEGRDGIGRKTEAPWIRLYSEKLSPSATTGFYVVIHFSIDGNRCYVTIGCGATKWDKHKGDLVKYSNTELERKVSWALSEINKAGAITDTFKDQIRLGSNLDLLKSFEKATILAKEYDPHNINEDEFLLSICKALRLLNIIYEPFSQGGDLLSSEVNDNDIETTINPTRRTSATRQGYGLSAAERKAIELRAMDVTLIYLEGHGYEVKDTSQNMPFDFLAKKMDEEIKVEVKGTTSTFVDAILMTSNEVKLHTDEKGKTALAIVYGIVLTERGNDAKCNEGKLEYISPWDITAWSLEPTAFQVIRP